MNVIVPCAGSASRFLNNGYKIHKLFLPIGKNDTMISNVCVNLYHKDFKYFFIANSQNTQEAQLREEIEKYIINYEIIWVNKLTNGPAMSCYLAKDKINNDESLIIANCDQIIEDLDYNTFFNFLHYYKPDGILGIFFSSSPKNSYVRINDNNEVIEVKEKQVISNLATNGFHYWKRAGDFFDSVDDMVKNKNTVNNEYYVSESYGYLLKNGLKIMPFYFNMHFPIGIPEDYESYRKARNL